MYVLYIVYIITNNVYIYANINLHRKLDSIIYE